MSDQKNKPDHAIMAMPVPVLETLVSEIARLKSTLGPVLFQQQFPALHSFEKQSAAAINGYKNTPNFNFNISQN